MARPWMPLYIGDYRADTAHLSAAQHGAYLLLIMHYWQHGKLPADDGQLARITALSPLEWAAMKPILRELFREQWAHKRIDRELEEAQSRYKRRAAAGSKGGASKARKQSSIATAQPAPASAPSNATAKTPLIAPGAFDLAEAYYQAGGIDRDDPAFAGLAYQASVWIDRGYDRNVILATAANLGRNKPGKPLRYHMKAIEQAHIDRVRDSLRKLPLAVAMPQQEVNNVQEVRREDAQDWRARRDRKHAAIVRLGERVAEDERRAAVGALPVRVVPDAG